MYELSTSDGYILEVLLYTGAGTASADNDFGHAYKIVMQLMKRYLRKVHAVFMDNFYTSIPLADALLKLGVQVTGTLRSNSAGIPGGKLKRGESVGKVYSFVEIIP